MFLVRRVGMSVALVALGATVAALRFAPTAPAAIAAKPGVARSFLRAAELANDVEPAPFDGDRALAIPTGAPTAIECDEARLVVAQARAAIAAMPPPVDAAKFAEATSDWLDPHGLWSVAPDAPAGSLIKHSAEKLLADLEAAPGSGACNAAANIGATLFAWSKELQTRFSQASAKARSEGPHAREDAARIAALSPFEDGPVLNNAVDLATKLGRSAGALDATFGESIAPFTAALRQRVAPSLDAEGWSKVVIAAALRAYIPQLDAHGAWAPLEEEISIYDLALEADPPDRLWTEMARTAVGVRIERGAAPPLRNGDIVLRVGDVPLAAVSVEQAEQLSVLGDPRQLAPARVTVLRVSDETARPHAGPSQNAVIDLDVQVPRTDGDQPRGPLAATSDLPVEMLRFGDGRAAIIGVPDVPDDLGARVGVALDSARRSRDLRGVVLDLRANGGGSTDGAAAALGYFLPGASLFPMRRRDGGIEVERAPETPAEQRYDGPLAVLVDGDSASAAEMIAGALSAYHRATVVGDRTYGKGCAQEYLDDEAHAGVLRLTTLLFALPDGSALQKTGISPNIRLTLPQVTEREALVTRALDPWHGPDVRDASRIREILWPQHVGRIGPCRDAVVCRALRALGSSPVAQASPSAPSAPR
jgi:carboxyl-terminal processing protease